MSAQNKTQAVRPIAGYHPSVWGDYFITHVTDEKVVSDWIEQSKVLKEEVRKKLKAASSNSLEQLKLIDIIKRLGISYHYETEIGQALQQIYCIDQDSNHKDDDLLTMSLRFRLLRQNGFNCSSDVFSNFKDDTGNFKENLISDVQGMLSLYEASFLSVPGEDILDKALEFTTHNLKSIVTQLGSPLVDQINHALKWPQHHNIERNVAWDTISSYQLQQRHDEGLLKFAKLDYNIVQSVIQNDIRMVSNWWIDGEFVKKMPYTRDRIVEGFFWAIGTYPLPQDARARRIMGQFITFVTYVDDTYDAYGFIDELELFTEAIERWDINAMNMLPDSMKEVYKSTLDPFNELEAELAKDGRAYWIPLCIEMAKHLARASMIQVRWHNKNYIPKVDEYKDNGIFSTGYPLLHPASYSVLGDIASKELMDWISTCPKLLKLTSIQGRIINDLKTHEFEKQREHPATIVECYMNEHGVSKEEAHTALWKVVAEMWKEINEEFLKATDVPLTIRYYLLGFARSTDSLYKDIDSFTHSNTVIKSFITKFAVNPFEV